MFNLQLYSHSVHQCGTVVAPAASSLGSTVSFSGTFKLPNFSAVANILSTQSERQRVYFKPLVPNDVYTSRTAQLTSRRCILNIYPTNILTEYFKHAAHSPIFLSSICRLFHNAIFSGSCNIHILNTGCANILKKIPAPKS